MNKLFSPAGLASHLLSIDINSVKSNNNQILDNRWFSAILDRTMLLLTNCEVHTGKYSDRSLNVQTEQSEVRMKQSPNIFTYVQN